MRRVIVSALALVLLPAAAFAQKSATEQQPPTPPPAQQQTQPAAPAPQTPAQPEKPALSFKTNAGLLLIQVKPDQVSTFEEIVSKLKAGFATTANADMKALAPSFRVYKAAEPMDGNSLYVMVVDPIAPGAEVWPLRLLANMLTDDEKRKPETKEMFDRYQGSIVKVAGQLNLTPVGGGM
jgi:hypothetical protein